MRVAFITHYSTLYGANRSLLNLIDGLKEFGVQAYVVCPRKGELLAALEERSIEWAVIPFRNWFGSTSIESRLKKPARLLANLAAIPRLSWRIRQWNADVIYTNSSVTPVGAWTARILGKPHIWHIREFGYLDFGYKYDWGKMFFEHWLNRANAVVTISKSLKQTICEDLHTRVYIIYNGVAFRADSIMSIEPKSPSKDYTFAIIGLTSPNKGQAEAIRAVAELRKDFPNIRLLVVGSDSGGYIDQLKQLSVDLKVSGQVEFWGYVNEPVRAYASADAVLMCSRHEAMGRVTAEAMAAARPVIGYDGGATPEIVENEVTGLLYNGGHQQLARCMKKFVESPQWAQQMGIKGRNKALEEFVVEVYSKRVYQVLQDVVGRPA